MIDLDDDRLAGRARQRRRTPARRRAAGSRPASPSRLDRFGSDGPTAVGVAAILAICVVLAVAPLRRTVADWLGIGSTRVIIEPIPTTVVPPTTAPSSTASTTTTTLPGIVDGLPTIDAATAESLLDGPLPALDGSSLGAPSRFVRMPEGGVVAEWPTGETLWIHASTMPSGVMFDKLASSSDSVQRIDDLGDDALAVTGDHMLRTPHRVVEATTTVLWVSGDQEFRLEGDRPIEELIDIARLLDAAR